MIYDVTLDEIVKGAVEAGQGRIFTSIPGKIVSYDPATQTCVVQPQIKVPIFDPDSGDQGTSETLPTLSNVPVGFFSGGGFSITFPLQAGDTCTIEFQMLATGQWRSTGELSEPLDIRKHSVGSAIVRPDARTMAKALLNPTLFSGMLTIGKDGDPATNLRIGNGMVACGGALPVPLAMALPTSTAIAVLLGAVTNIGLALAQLVPANTVSTDSGAAATTAAGTCSAAAGLVGAQTAILPSTVTMGQ